MGKTSGQTRSVKKTGGFRPNDWNYKGTVENIRSLVTVKSPQVYKELKQAISSFEAHLGVKERNIKIADLGSNTNGVQMTYVSGENAGIYLNSKVFDLTPAQIRKRVQNSLTPEKGKAFAWSTDTKKPIQRTLTHELAHALWNTTHNRPNDTAAGKVITGLYKKWLADPNYRRRKKHGIYAQTNVNEFFAETITKELHGNSDKYSNALKKIVKKYKL